jgi:hypothetical protein
MQTIMGETMGEVFADRPVQCLPAGETASEPSGLRES